MVQYGGRVFFVAEENPFPKGETGWSQKQFVHISDKVPSPGVGSLGVKGLHMLRSCAPRERYLWNVLEVSWNRAVAKGPSRGDRNIFLAARVDEPNNMTIFRASKPNK